MSSFTSPLLGSSPPAKSPSLPIKRGGLSRSFAAAQTVKLGPDVGAAERRSSETGGQQRQQASFSFSKTPFASMATSTATSCSSSSARPPVPARPSLRVEGFSAPAETSNNVALSPGKLQTKSSLLTASLLTEPAALSPELFGAVQPQQTFQVRPR
jgi:hypothetical protein